MLISALEENFKQKNKANFQNKNYSKGSKYSKVENFDDYREILKRNT